MAIRKAKTGDIPYIMGIFMACTDIMLEKGIEQWDYSYPSYENMNRDVQEDSAYVYTYRNRVQGTITLNEQQDKQYKGVNWAFKSKKALIIHRLAVHPEAQGKGIASQLCTFAEQFAQENDFEVIRLDAYTGNPVSQYLYPKLGYQLADGCCYFHGNEIPFNCFEKLIKK